MERSKAAWFCTADALLRRKPVFLKPRPHRLSKDQEKHINFLGPPPPEPAHGGVSEALADRGWSDWVPEGTTSYQGCAERILDAVIKEVSPECPDSVLKNMTKAVQRESKKVDPKIIYKLFRKLDTQKHHKARVISHTMMQEIYKA
eukprot:3879334-Amphidinium_carterae.1